MNASLATPNSSFYAVRGEPSTTYEQSNDLRMAKEFSKWMDGCGSAFQAESSYDPLGCANRGRYYVVFHVSSSSSMVESALENFRGEIGIHHSSTNEIRTSVVKAALVAVYELDAVGQNRRAAQEMMRFIENHLHATSLDVANRLLLEADVTRLSSRSLIGLIRSTARANAVLPAWNRAYKASRVAVKKQGKDPNALFLGLPSIQEE